MPSVSATRLAGPASTKPAGTAGHRHNNQPLHQPHAIDMRSEMPQQSSKCGRFCTACLGDT
jgi:hypothetical protein